ncbi:LysR family transcriptional regulator [Pseudohalocynthiibacter aestuariivivens]|jgi:DNA-binding transcriptional LysR family regulator|uniref:LysR family transcriptional regulator n=1 Tax=Pseudohalocynthiibacter aestuariivivens TaxID=1591409 RepID=A0ABV5JD17_9RHOB|nr:MULTISPECIES: LysR family transcriptional regulator [Pseudohalocynthiibacter]MBS9718388.1 LysR family transcriptional regulator [Pseudohalocynthiibacter aestuariivivens]MCK0103397.1 LysR family transcriptional regulator [Pseudohalocynthiibacter sp. F2068]
MVDTPGRITLWGIEVFAATAEEGSISAAARRLGASASAVSQQITNLEGALGATLFNRSARPVSLTPAGEIFRRRAQSILNEAEQARAELATADLSSLTRFRLGMIEDFDADVTPHFLTEMASDLKGCQFLLETGASHRLFDLLDARALDVIVAADLGASAPWMEVHPLLEEPFLAAVPKGLVDQGGDVLAQLNKLPLIQYTARHVMGRQIAAHLARQNLRLSHRFELDSYHAIMAMVASGAGWTILTPLGYLRAQRFCDKADLVPLPFAPLSRTISLNARRDVLGDMPAQAAVRLRKLLDDMIVKPARANIPWLGNTLRLL